MTENRKNNEEEYRKTLKAHDWYYNFSDDHRVWQRGLESYKKLTILRKENDPNFSIWNEYAPNMFKARLAEDTKPTPKLVKKAPIRKNNRPSF